MSVVATAPYTIATGNGVTTSFPFFFACRNPDDIAVYINGVPLSAGFTVTLNSDFNSGTVVTSIPPVTGAAIILASQPKLGQPIAFENAGPYNPSTVDGAFDTAAIRSIFLASLLARTALVPIGETMGPLPPQASRIGMFFGFDAAGNPAALSGTGVDAALRTDLAGSGGAALSGFNQPGGVARTVQAKLQDVISVRDFGAVGDGVTDDHAAIAAAAAAARGKRLTFPKGNYVISSDGGSIVLEEVDLVGEGVLDGATGTIDEGAMLWITGTTNSPFLVRRGVSVEGLGIYYPNQVDSATPTLYPTTFAFDFTDGPIQFVTFRHNVIYNAYRFMDIDNGTTGGVGHVEIVENYICAISRGIYVRYNAEHIRIERNNFTFGHWLAATEGGTRGYMRANAIAIQIDQSDGLDVENNLYFGYHNGVLLAGIGLCIAQRILASNFDQVLFPIRAVGPGLIASLTTGGNSYAAFNSQNTALQGRAISIETTGTGVEDINIGADAFEQATQEHIYVTGDNPTRRIIVGAKAFQSWASFASSGTYGAINVNGAVTNLQVTGGSFSGAGNPSHSYGIVGTMNKLQVTGADFDLTVAALNVSASIATVTGNRSTNTSGSTSDMVSALDIAQSGNRWDKPTSLIVAVSTSAYTVGPRDISIIASVASTLTLPSPAAYTNRELMIRNTAAVAVISASSNVVPVAGGAAGTAILAATAGKWARLVSDGTSWQVMAAN